MNFKKSPKIFKGYKCDNPENTVKIIQDGFKNIGLHLFYNEKKISSNKNELYWGEVVLNELGFSTWGKGTSSILSKASAFAEMVERFSSAMFFFENVPFPEDSYRYRKMFDDILYRKFLRNFKKNEKDVFSYSELKSQYFGDKLSKNQYNLYKDSNLLYMSVDAFSLTGKNWKAIPLRAIEITSGSNGLAAGNTIEEAIAQGTCEIFERYAVVEILLKNLSCPTIDPKTTEDKDILRYIEMFKSLNIEVIIKDFTMNNKLPVVGVVFTNNNIKDDDFNELKKNQLYKRIECASHVNLKEAILRCFTEYIQTLGANNEKEIMFNKESDLIYKCWTGIIGKKYSGDVEAFRYLTRRYDYRNDISFLEKGDIISFNKLKSISNDDSLDDCNELISICKKNNWDMFCVDYTHKIIGFPVVRVIIPPFSIDFDPFSKGSMKKTNLGERVDYFYGIKDFYRYVTNDDWIKDEKKIKDLIGNIEEFLAKEPFSYKFSVIRENFFRQTINLYHILAMLYLSIGEFEESKKYLKALILLEDISEDKHFFMKHIKRVFSSDFYSNLIDLIDYICVEDLNMDYSFLKNPFNPEETCYEVDKYYSALIKLISQSFLSKNK